MTELGEDLRICQSERTAARVIEGRGVVIVIDQQKLHTLNEVGTRVWELADGRALSEIVDAVTAEFEVERAQALDDVRKFVEEMCGLGAIELRKA